MVPYSFLMQLESQIPQSDLGIVSACTSFLLGRGQRPLFQGPGMWNPLNGSFEDCKTPCCCNCEMAPRILIARGFRSGYQVSKKRFHFSSDTSNTTYSYAWTSRYMSSFSKVNEHQGHKHLSLLVIPLVTTHEPASTGVAPFAEAAPSRVVLSTQQPQAGSSVS